MSQFTVSSPDGAVCSVDHHASAAGAAILRAGGNAADAAVATSAALAVTTQHMCGLGGDLFALVHHGPAIPDCLNSSGRAGSGADPDTLRAEGATTTIERVSAFAFSHATPEGCRGDWHRRWLKCFAKN